MGIIGTGAAAYVIGVRELAILKGNPQYPINLDCPYNTHDPALLELDVYGHDLKHKWSPNPQYIDMDLFGDIAHAAGEVALKAWKLLGCRDDDIRQDKIGLGAVPNFIEVNPIAGLAPNWSDLPQLAKAIWHELRPSIGLDDR